MFVPTLGIVCRCLHFYPHAHHHFSYVYLFRLKVNVLVEKNALETLMGSDFRLCLMKDMKVGGQVRKGNVAFIMVPSKP